MNYKWEALTIICVVASIVTGVTVYQVAKLFAPVENIQYLEGTENE